MRADDRATPASDFNAADSMGARKEQILPRAGEKGAVFSLSECMAIATLPAADIDRARRFYADKLGLTPTPGVAPGHYLYRCGGTSFALRETTGKASGTHDQLGFLVSDLDAVVRHLKSRGVAFTTGITEDERTRTARFEDTEGNRLMLREILACPAPNSESDAESSRHLP